MDYKKTLIHAGIILWEHKAIPLFFITLFSIPFVLFLVPFGILVFRFDPSQSGNLVRSLDELLGFWISVAAFPIFIWIPFTLLSIFSCPSLIFGWIGVCAGVSSVEDRGYFEVGFFTLAQTSWMYLKRITIIFLAIAIALFALVSRWLLPLAIIEIVFSIPVILFLWWA